MKNSISSLMFNMSSSRIHYASRHVGNAEALNCYYAHGEENSNFQRRSYWMLDPEYEHIVLVHYRDIGAGKQNAASMSQFSTFCSSTIDPSNNSSATQQPDSSFVIGESYELYHNQSSPSSVEISSSQMKDPVPNHFDIIERTDEVNSSSVPDLSQALRRIEQQLSLNDEEVEEMRTFYVENEHSKDLEDVLCDYESSGQTPNVPDLLSEQSGDGVQQHHQLPAVEVDIWNEVLYSSQKLPNLESQTKFGAQYAIPSSLQHVDSQEHHAYSSVPHACGTTQHYYSSLFDQDGLGTSPQSNISLTFAQKQKFTMREISPDWCYSSVGAKIIIIGSFLSDPSECAWACMIGDSEVPVQIIQEGVLCCHAPPHVQGKVNICITSGNQESCSEVREFEYRAKPNVCTHSNLPKTEINKSSEELLLLVRFVQMLLSDILPKGDVSRSRINLLGKSRMSEDSWSQIIDSLLVGTSTSSSTLDWLLQELLKDKLEIWLSCKLQKNNLRGCSLSKKEQGIIHMVAGLGFEWALQPILNSGVSINFRDINGWTALHWAARFGREKMVAALIALGASAGAVTDPNSQDPTGKTAAAIAATCGHRGLAGYLSEVALTSHLSSLTLEESELSKGSAAAEAERRVNILSKESSSSNEDQVFLKHTLAAVRNSAQAAARIQSAFRAHSFQKRQQREAAVAIGDASRDEYCILAHNIRGFQRLRSWRSAMYVTITQLLYLFRRNIEAGKDINQENNQYVWCPGEDKILDEKLRGQRIFPAHVRGYQVRKNCKVCWAVGILDKVILRWRRGGVGLRGFRHDSESIDESEDEDILKVFRKQKVDAAIDEAVSRVLSMVESPDARQQYHRILETYGQAKAELESAEADTASQNS
ncbi:UNVERIFIED_CONTAM: Calmodulin-binding transcription activator 4 [Sesamum latifolium]|uniref:Calmodulin-binding transcription activator 4 n=1 Tax=Sesamum latifolium TaxID=2727402 RepID=A0AAW2WZX5_9LAMI